MTTTGRYLPILFDRRRSRPVRSSRADKQTAPWLPSPDSDAYSAAVARLADTLLREGLRAGAATILLEPQSRSVVVSHQTEQTLHEQVRLPRHLSGLLLAHWRSVAGMNPAEGHYPQQGCFIALFGAVRHGILVSITLTPWGERVELSLMPETAAA